MVKYKTCIKCNKTLDIKKFWRNSQTKDGYDNKCEDCFKKYLKRYRSERPPLEYQYNKGKPWSSEDIEYLIMSKNAPGMELAYALGRSYGSVIEKRRLVLQELDRRKKNEKN